jgi:long-subunit fatty acid transport protein
VKRVTKAYWIALLLVALTAPTASAGLGGAAYSYGFGARGISMGMAYTMLADDASAAYFNPAAMPRLTNSEFALTYMYAQPEFQGGPKGDTYTFDLSNRVIQLNWVTKLNSLFKSNQNVALGLNISLDDNGAAFMRMYDRPNADGYYYFYGPSNFVLNGTLGFAITDWLSLGGGVVTTLHSVSTFEMKTDLAGNTEDEGTTLDADVVFSPIASGMLRFKWVDIAATWHGRTWGQFQPIEVDATAKIGENDLADLPMSLNFKDGYMPHRVGLGTYWRPTDWLNIAADVVWHNWKDFENLIQRDDLPRENIKIETKDLFVPHLGLEFVAYENLFLRTGYSYQDTPIDRPGSSANLILDNAKHIGSAGIGYDWVNPPLLANPVRFDAAYFLHYLVPADIRATDGVDYESSGYMNGMAITLTLRY